MSCFNGYNSWFALGEESTWGTPVARTVFGEMTEDSMTAISERVQSGAFRRANQFNHVPGKQGAEGGVGVEMSYVDAAVLMLTKHLMGKITTQNDTPEVGAYTHTLELSDEPVGDLAGIEGLSLEINRDATSTFLYAGYVVNEGTFTLEPDGYLGLSAVGAAKQETLVSPSTPSYSAANLAHHAQAALTWGGTTKEVTSLEIAVNNAFALDRRVLGSRNIAVPCREGKREVTGSFPKFFDALAEYQDFVNATSRVLEVTLTGGTIPTTSTAYSITMTLSDVVLEGTTPTVDSPGFLSQPLEFRAYETASEKPLKIVVVTDLATI